MRLRILTHCSYIVFFKLEISERAGRVDSKDVDRVSTEHNIVQCIVFCMWIPIYSKI